MDYLILKAVHVSSAMASLALFAIRANWMVWTPERSQQRWIRIIPHAVDTVLLLSAIALLLQLGGMQALTAQSWLMAKIAALLIYIVLGRIALKNGRTLRVRIVAFFGAIAVFGYIVSVAVAKSPYGFISWL